MSIDKSLRRKNMLARSRNVLTRAERIKVLQSDERFPEGRSPYGLPKVRVLKVGERVEHSVEHGNPGRASSKNDQLQRHLKRSPPCVRWQPQVGSEVIGARDQA